MQRTKIVGLSALVVLALMAVLASSAQAGTLGTCVKAPKVDRKYTGKFKNKTCTESEPKGEGKYEFKEIKAGVKFTSSGGKATLKGKKGDITCESEADEGETLNGKEATDVIKFIGCILSITGGKCTSSGAMEGEIVTNTLTSHTIDHGEKGLGGQDEPAEGEVWQDITPTPPNEYLAEFVCSDTPFKVKGSVAGVTGPVNVATKAGKPGKKPKYTFTQKFGETVGEQDLTTIDVNPISHEVEESASIQEGEGGTFFSEKGLEIKT